MTALFMSQRNQTLTFRPVLSLSCSEC